MRRALRNTVDRWSVPLIIGVLVAEFLWIRPSAQVVTGTILGTVRDTTGGVIPDTGITLTQQSTGLSRSVTADKNGDYSAPLLATGVYTLRAKPKASRRRQFGDRTWR